MKDHMQFSHTYLVRDRIDEGCTLTYLFSPNSNEYKIVVIDGYIEYHACDGSHIWRINPVPDKFGHYVAECIHPPFNLPDGSMMLV